MRIQVSAAFVLLCAFATAASAQQDPPLAYPLHGTASLRGCSGALFIFEGQSMDDNGLIMTNGHCLRFMDRFEVTIDQPSVRQVTLFDANDQKTRQYDTTRIVYATMFDTDLAILELADTYQQILDESNVTPIVLSSAHPQVGSDMVVVSGFHEYVTKCTVDGFVFAMREAQWSWTDSIRYSQECETFGGTSGSPVIDPNTGLIIGVNNTGYEGGDACSLNNPCEIDEDGNVTTIANGAYGQQTYQVYSCIDENFDIDLSLPGCALPAPSGALAIAGIELNSALECDDDGVLDGGESGVLTVFLTNDGQVDLVDTTVVLASNSPAISFPDGTTITVGAVARGATVEVNANVALADDISGIQTVAFEVLAADPSAIVPQVENKLFARVNFDDAPNSSTIDDVESNIVVWETTALAGNANWDRTVGETGNTTWFAADIGSTGDQLLQSPVLEVGDESFVVRLAHRFKFETSDNTFWDGGVVELSIDNGATWADVSDYAADVGYGGTITNRSGNPLADRQAFVDASPNYPAMSSLVLDFGTQLAGESVLLRFRLGTDRGAGDFGWELDDIEVEGITNTPFGSVQTHTCTGEPPGDTTGGDGDTTGGDGDTTGGDDTTGDGDTTGGTTRPRQESGGCAVNGSGNAFAWPMFFLLALFGLRRRRQNHEQNHG